MQTVWGYAAEVPVGGSAGWAQELPLQGTSPGHAAGRGRVLPLLFTALLSLPVRAPLWKNGLTLGKHPRQLPPNYL